MPHDDHILQTSVLPSAFHVLLSKFGWRATMDRFKFLNPPPPSAHASFEDLSLLA
ncbi:unnamed protein product [Protopolystoma xenopodis]|uniref:Uncharacterized protein n=1 Tax=Protopolystoma xenopodis TaxID=117903 RepID=A0A3S5ACX4_9PLAT|nr:unnamed protein product [Protopolystoma xenopodis]